MLDVKSKSDGSSKHSVVKTKFFLCDIAYIESINRKIILHMFDKSEQAYEIHFISFERAVKEFLGFGFVQTHRVCAVNPSCVFAIEKSSVVLKSGIRLPLSHAKRDSLLHLAQQYAFAV